MPQHITLAEVKKAGRNYYNRGMLTAQHPVASKRECIYRIDDRRCVIGAALTPETIDAIEAANLQDMGVAASGMDQFITYDEHEHDALRDLQLYHDQWAQKANGTGYVNPDVDKAHDEFRYHLFAD